MEALRELAHQAGDVGVPRAQLEHFLAAGYVPQPKQLAFHAAARACDAPDGPDEIGFGGASGPGKSHAVFAQMALDDCRRVPGLKALYLRKVGRSAREQFEDLRRSVLSHAPHRYRRQAGVVELWDGARIFIGHFRNESEIDNYLGIEYDLITIEETTTLSALKYQALRDSNRSAKPGWRPRIYNSTNPGGVGHTWYKRRFIDPWRAQAQRFTRFIPATVADNRFIDGDYRRKLEENRGWRLRAYRFGDWDIAAGQFFSTWREDVHVSAPFAIPNDWPLWLGMDYGFVHPTVLTLLTLDGDGQVYVVGEHAASRWLPQRHVEALESLLARHGRTLDALWPAVAGSDVFARKGHGPTIAEQYAALGLSLTAADSDRVNGAARVLDLLGDPEVGIDPRLTVFNTCPHVIEQIPALLHDPNRPEDVLKVDVDDEGRGGDDAYDALRYGLMVRGVGAQPSRLVAAPDPLTTIDASVTW